MTNFQLWKRVAHSLLHLEMLKLENKEREMVEMGRRGSNKSLDQVSHIHGHLFYGSIVEGLDVPQSTLVIFCHHVDGYTFPAKTASSANPKSIKDNENGIEKNSFA